jgi:SH3-like domain-containing protein
VRQALAAILAALPLAAAAAPATYAPRGTPCDISAYLTDQDPNGLNVRAGPSGETRVLRKVDNSASSGVARIKGRSGAWYRVSTIVDAETDALLFRGDGWVHGSLVGLDVANGDPKLYARPSERGPVLARLTADQAGVTLIGCEGRWAKVRADGRIGWLSPDGQCSNPLTTCS